MNPIPIQWTDLEIAVERNAPEIESFIRKATGEVLTVIEGAEGADALRREVRGRPEDFIRVEPVPSREQYRWMERFVASVSDPDARRRLLIAIDGKGAFRRFKDVLLAYPIERERWFAYRSDWLHWHINQWLQARQIPTETPPWGWNVEPPPMPEPLPRAAPGGESLGETLRRRAHDALEILPVGELPAALTFLEYLRDRGSAELSGGRARLDKLRRIAGASHAVHAARAAGQEEGEPERGDDEREPLEGLEHTAG